METTTWWRPLAGRLVEFAVKAMIVAACVQVVLNGTVAAVGKVSDDAYLSGYIHGRMNPSPELRRWRGES